MSNSIGSMWHRWDPHLHAPGTLHNNQFGGGDAWDQYLTRLEDAEPRIRALGITDYYLLDLYKAVARARDEGRLPEVDLVFPNVECRLDKATVRNRWVNIHLLVDPTSKDHLVELERFMSRLLFRAHGDTFACTPSELERLGRASDPQIVDDRTALKQGANQFKVGFSQLREIYEQSDWARANLLVAVSGKGTDGTSGVREASDRTLREEIEKFAHIIFDSSPAQREFWLGHGSATKAELWERFLGPKPCLHGSDAHDLDAVGRPDGDRFSWMKGRPSFDTLRQACIDPESRSYVGVEPPSTGSPSQSIDSVEFADADWMGTKRVPLNPGLVAVIGPRGSGKTALADAIAVGCDVFYPRAEPAGHPGLSASFLDRAHDLLEASTVTLNWRAGDPSSRALDGKGAAIADYPRARYLSQQFVEELCSASGMTDELLREIERVVFEAHPRDEIDGVVSFEELLSLRAMRPRQARARSEAAIGSLSERIGNELEKDRRVAPLEKMVVQKRKLLESYQRDRTELVGKGQEQRAERLSEVSIAREKVQSRLRALANQRESLLALHDEVKNMRAHEAPEMLRAAKERYAASRMNDPEWEPFLLDYRGDVDAQIKIALERASNAITKLRGVSPPPGDPDTSLLPADTELHLHSAAVLDAEIARLEKLVAADKLSQRRLALLNKKIAEESAALTVAENELNDAKGAKQRARDLQAEREDAYRGVFESIEAEEDVLRALYAPLSDRIAEAEGTLGKLNFDVSRTVDVGEWAGYAESELVDLRRKGSFKGQGSLIDAAEATLRNAWTTGSVDEAVEAMETFRDTYQKELLDHSIVPKGDQDYRQWLKNFARWLYSTDHIRLEYSISFEGVDIRSLSPGTRGIVLLLLYLALDDEDTRPLIIDQPEENLDPKSVFDELVQLFVAAKSRRQVIIVTHNANLVVNTDADQVIIASAHTRAPGELPTLKYTSGGIEEIEVRREVCNILEGGEEALIERARRLRIQISGRTR